MSLPHTASIALEASSLLVVAPSGVAVFGRSLIQGLREKWEESRLRLIYRVSRWPRRRFLADLGLAASPYLTGRFLHRRHPLLHALDTRCPESYRGVLVATVFDVISALPVARERRLSTARFRAEKCRQYEAIARRAAAIVTVSEETRLQLERAFSPRGKVVVAYPGVDPLFHPRRADPRVLERHGVGEKPYLLFVGDLAARKNLEAVFKAYWRARSERSDLRLVIAGRPSFGWEESPARARLSSRPEGIHLLGYVPRDDLAALYAGARAFLFLSHYEGFGMPVLEAMASGAPVVAARRGGIPEAAGPAALLVDPDQEAEVDRAVAEILSDPRRAGQLREAGLARAALFSWEACAGAVTRLYRDLLGR
ncbi:MAG: glycosyltransferase family 4 protein [Planctomycetes bacterium]|nr:glycosyltransferase family 4 protein [Planctomycetota bacterium]